MQLRALTLKDSEPWAELLALTFDRSNDEMVQLLHWLYAGHDLIAWGIWDGARLAAQYCSMLTALLMPDLTAPVCVGLSINLAVHPAYRGRGLVKQAAQPVYVELAARGGLAGVGFSNAAGVQVDRRSRGYGYQVVGQLQSKWVWLRPTAAEPLTLAADWPNAPLHLQLPAVERIRLATSDAWLHHRFAHHPFRRYHFGIKQTDDEVSGLVIYRPIRWGPIRGASLLAAYGDNLADVLRRWSSALQAGGVYFVQTLLTPSASLFAALQSIGIGVTAPYTRSPYYLTLKPLQPGLPASVFDFTRWDCVGGDIL